MKIQSVQLNQNSITIIFNDSQKKYVIPYSEWKSQYQSQQEVSSEEYEQIVLCAEKHTIMQKALDLLARREHSQKELIHKLKTRYQNRELISTVVQELHQKGIQSEERYAKTLISTRIAQTEYGPYYLLQEALSKGISKDVAQQWLHEFSSDELWLEKARKVLQRSQYEKKDQKQKQKIWQKLYRKGFSSELIHLLIQEWETNEG